MVGGGGDHGGRCLHSNRCLRTKAAYSIRRRGSDCGGGGGSGSGTMAHSLWGNESKNVLSANPRRYFLISSQNKCVLGNLWLLRRGFILLLTLVSTLQLAEDSNTIYLLQTHLSTMF